MRRLLILVGLLAMMIMVVAAPAAAAGGFSTTLSYPAEAAYYSVAVDLIAGVPFRAHLQCALESTSWDTPGSIDPYLELYAPGDEPLIDSWIVAADDNGDQDCAGWYDAIIEYTPGVSGTYTLVAFKYAGNSGLGYLSLSGINNAISLPFPDGRINQEQWATAAVFCVVNGNIDIYAINASGVGSLVIREDWAALEALGIPAQNELRAQSEDGSIRLYRLSSGEWQINAPADGNENGYVYRWRECTPGGSSLSVGISGPFVYEEEGGGEEPPGEPQ